MADVIDVIMRMTDQVTGPLQHIRTEMEQNALSMTRLGKNVSNVGQNMSSIGQSMLPMAGAIGTIGTVSVKTFMDVESAVVSAGVKAGATEEQISQMMDTAKELGAKFPISTKEAAVAMDELAAAGFDAEQTMGAMPSIVQASVASGEDLATTSNVVSSALSIWNLKTGDIAQNTEHVADVIQQAANVSKLGMQDFGLAMQYAGGPASSLGVGIEELSVSMGIMANNGIEASTIGTSLRSTMLNLTKPTDDMQKALNSLGIQVEDENGKFIGMHEYVSRLRTAMQGMGDMQKANILTTLAGKEAVSGLMAVINTSPEQYDEMRQAIENADGSSAAAFERMRATTKGSIKEMEGAVESLGLELGQMLAPNVMAAASVVNDMAAAIQALTPEQKQLAVEIGAAVIGFTAFMLVAGKVLSTAGSLIRVYGDVGKVMHNGHLRNKALEYSVRGVMGAFSELGSAGTLMAARLGAMKTLGGSGMMSVLRAELMLTRLRMTEFIGAARVDVMKAAFENMASTVSKSLADARMAATGAMSSIRSQLVMTMAQMRALTWHQVGANIRTTFSSAAAGVAEHMRSAVASVQGAANRIRAISWAQTGANIRTTFSNVASSVAGSMSNVRVSVVSGVRALGTQMALAAAHARAFTASLSIQGILATAASGLRGMATALLGVGKAALAFVFSPLGIAIAAIAGAAYLVYSNWDKVGPFFQSLWNTIKQAFNGAVQSLQPSINMLKTAAAGLQQLFTTYVKTALTQVGIAINNLRPVFTSLGMTINTLVTTLGGRLMTAFNSIRQAMQQNSGAIRVLQQAFQLVAAILGGAVVAGFIVFANVAMGAVVGAINIIASVIGSLIGVLSGIITFITGVFAGDWSTAWSGIIQIFSSIFSGIEGVCNGVLSGIKAAINGIISSINGISFTVPDWVPGVGGQSFQPSLPMLYAGTDNWHGGPAMIHDRGAEIVDLPQGTRVIPHDQSIIQAQQMGIRRATSAISAALEGRNTRNPVTPVDLASGFRMMAEQNTMKPIPTQDVTISAPLGGQHGKTQETVKSDQQFHISINMGGVTVMDCKADAQTLSKEIVQNIVYELQKRAVNMNIGAI